MRKFGVLAVVAGLLVVPSDSSSLPTPPAVSGQPSRSDDTAMARARRTGQPVEDIALGSETRQVFANPHGTYTARVHARPVRTRKGAGWVPLDTTLRARPDGRVAPVAVPGDLELSGGGGDPLVRFRLDGKELALRWPRPLPAPVLAGSSATYPDVLPGVDLVAHATPTGFSEVLVVKSAAAARQPALSRVRFGLSSTGLTMRTDTSGTTAAVDERGHAVVTLGTAWMWDSSGGTEPRGPDGLTAVPRDREPAPGDLRRRMGLVVERDGLTIVPDHALLRDPRTTFPVYLDPQWPAGRQHWLMLAQDLPNYGWWDSAYDTRVGRDPDDSATDRFRSYFQMDTSFLADKLIKKGIFTFAEKWRYSCMPEPVYLWRSAPITSNQTWSTSPSLLQRLGSVTTPRSSTDCGVFELAEFDVRSLLSDAAAGHWPEIAVALASDESATANGGKVFDNNPFIDIEYNTVPFAPVQISTAGVAGCSDTAAVHVKQTRPELRVRLEDADTGQPIRATVEWREVGTTTSRTLDSASRVPGDEVTVTVPTDLTAGRTYEWRARAYNENTVTDIDVGPFTAWCRFAVDTSPPATQPGVTRVCSPTCPGYQVDQPAQFLFDARGDADISSFMYTLGTAPALTIPAVNGKATATITPTSVTATLQVYGVDRAGNVGLSYKLLIIAKGLPPAAALWPVNLDTPAVLADTRGTNPIRLYGGYSWQTGQDGGDAVGLDGDPSTGGHTDGPVLHTNASFTAMAWVRLDDTGDWRVALGQAGSAYNGFELRYEMPTRRWAFVMRASDADGAAENTAQSNTLAQAGVWTHLAGVYDHEAGELRIYVDGRLAGRTPHRSTWDATGTFGIGYRNYYGFAPSRWQGLLDDIQVYSFAASDRKIFEAMKAVGRWGPTAWWTLDSTDADSTNGQHTLARIGGTSWTTRRQGLDALSLNGSTGSAYTANPVVHTDGSFSVAAWVRLDRATDTAIAVSQDGRLASGFGLGYLKDVGWAFTKRRADAAGPTVPVDSAAYAAPVQLGVWTHLAGVYDKARQQLLLYVNGRLAATSPHESTWDATGSLVLGRGYDSNGGWSHFWPGALDDVRVTGMTVNAGQIKDWMASDLSFAPQATWDLDDPVGSTRRDATGNGHTLFVTTGGTTTTGKRGSALQLDSTAGAVAYTAGPVAHTNKSFTVAAWVRPDRLDRSATAVSQDGLADSGFTLGYDLSTKQWTFAMSREDRTDGLGSTTTVRSTKTVPASTWTHLAGTYDDKKHEIKLYVDGELVGTTPHSSSWDAAGPLLIGRGKLDGAARDWWPGAVDEARVVDFPMAPEEVRALLVSTTLGPGAWWPLDETAGTGARDGSGNGYPLALAGNASWTAGRCGNGLLLDGGTGQATAPGPVLRTDQSFTVTAWVRLDRTGADAAAMSQDGQLASSFYLGYNVRLNKWWFILPTADSSNPEDVVAFSATPAQSGTWTHLAGVYDATTHQMRLYVNGVSSTATAVSATWNAVGATRLGGAQWNGGLVDHWPGAIDDARALGRAATAPDIQAIMADCQPAPGWSFTNTNDVAIPDRATVESSIVVSGMAGNAPAALRVGVTIRHTYRGDLVIDLISPSGRQFRLKDSSASDNADDVVATYQVNASAEPANGTWRLRVQDVVAGDTGYLDQWSLSSG